MAVHVSIFHWLLMYHNIVNKQPATANSILHKHGHEHHDHFTDVSPETNWKSCLEHAEKIGLGTHEYELIEI